MNVYVINILHLKLTQKKLDEHMDNNINASI
jgi:hypothetical protein